MQVFSLIPSFAIDSIEENMDNGTIIENNNEYNLDGDLIKNKNDDKDNKDDVTDNTNKSPVDSELKENEALNFKTEEISSECNVDENNNILENENINKEYNTKPEDEIKVDNTFTKNKEVSQNNTVLDNNSALGALGFYATNGGLTESFSPDKKDYTAVIKGTATTFRFGKNTVAVKSKSATMNIYLNDEIIYENITGTTEQAFTLTKGIINVLKIIVTAESGDQSQYIVRFEREGASDNSLGRINFYNGYSYLEKAFDPKVKDYIAIVKNNYNIVSFIANQDTYVKDPYATMDVYFNNELIFENITKTPARVFTIEKNKANIMKFVVTAENGDETTYTITFKREGSNDTSLSLLGFYSSSNILTEQFTPDKKDYVGIIKNNANTFSFIEGHSSSNSRVRDPYATMDVYFNDELIFKDITKTPDKTLALVKDKINTLKFIVTAESGVQSTYTVIFEREGYSDTRLSLLGFYSSSTILTEPFDPEKRDYIGILKSSSSSFEFIENHSSSNSRVKDPYATMDVYFNDELIFKDITKTPDKTLELKKNIENVLRIVVTAENGSQGTYTVRFEREYDCNTNIKNILINKGNLVFEDDTYIATMTSWQDVVISKLDLEDKWADYKLILNGEREILVNEQFDLNVGENKLDVEVTSNNGTKKTYPIIFKRADSENPTVTCTRDTEEWANTDVLINIEAFDESDIRYIQLPNGEKVYSNEVNFYAEKNGIYEFKIYDNFLNETIETVEIKNIDKELPKIELKPSTTDLTNESVDITVNVYDNVGIKSIETPDGQVYTKNSFVYIVHEDGEYTFKIIDLAGNEATKSITLNNIDSRHPVLATELSNNDWSNEELTLSVFAISDKGIKYIELPDGTKVQDNFAEYGINENGTYFIATESLGGNITSEKVIVNNIDTEAPTINLDSSIENWTNEDVSIICSAEDNVGIEYIVLPNGEIFYGNYYEYTATSNGTYEFIAVDLAGNETKESIEIANIDKNPPIIENYDDLVSVLNNIIILDLSTVETPSGIYKVILPNEDEIIEPEEDIIEYEVKYNDTYKFVVVDNAGNSTDIDVKVDSLIDKNTENNSNNNNNSANESNTENTDKHESLKLPNTGGVYGIITTTSIILMIIGAITIFKRKK